MKKPAKRLAVKKSGPKKSRPAATPWSSRAWEWFKTVGLITAIPVGVGLVFASYATADYIRKLHDDLFSAAKEIGSLESKRKELATKAETASNDFDDQIRRLHDDLKKTGEAKLRALQQEGNNQLVSLKRAEQQLIDLARQVQILQEVIAKIGKYEPEVEYDGLGADETQEDFPTCVPCP
jgi:uncharacterized membrane protein YgaE (UPF0421/DUF939 family)